MDGQYSDKPLSQQRSDEMMRLMIKSQFVGRAFSVYKIVSEMYHTRDALWLDEDTDKLLREFWLLADKVYGRLLTQSSSESYEFDKVFKQLDN